MGLFQKRTKSEKLKYHANGEKRILSKLKGKQMDQDLKDARSAGYMACARENIGAHVWANATPAEREALKTLGKDRSKRKQYWALQKTIKDRVKAAKGAAGAVKSK